MLISKYYLMDGVTRLSGIVKSKSLGTETLRERVLEITRNMLMASEELLVTLDSFSIIAVKDAIMSTRQNVLTCQTPEDIEKEINKLARELGNTVDYNSGSYRDFSTRIRTNISSTESIDERVFEELKSVLSIPEREVSILDPVLLNSYSTVNLKKIFPVAKTYGISATENYPHVINTNIDRLAVGKGDKCRISNDAFDILFVHTDVEWETRIDNVKAVLSSKREKINLLTNLKYVREDGVVILSIPYYKLYDDICNVISRNLTDVKIFRYGTIGDNPLSNVFVIGKRKPHNNKKLDETTFLNLIDQISDYNKIPFLADMQCENVLFTIPKLESKIDTFRGSIINRAEALSLCQETGLINTFLQNEKKVELSTDKNPLLPFNIGQIGLVLTSGCLDGIIDEGDGNYHVIKGRVKKDIVRDTELIGDNQIEVNETFQNKVEISIMMGNGEYKILA